MIKFFSKILIVLLYLYGCIILGDGSLVLVIDGIKLLEKILYKGELNIYKFLGIKNKLK